MKTVATFALTALVLSAAAVTLAQTRRVSLVKGTPTNYGAYGFDISWVDSATQKYYLADRSNSAIDLVDAATDTFIGFIGKGQFTGSRPCPGHPKDLRHCSGPNGVVTDDLGHLWAGDGAGNIIEADAAKPGTPILRKIPTGGKFRVDELAYDPIDKIVMTSNDGDAPPFLTFVSAVDGTILGQYKYPAGQDGMEQPAWDPDTGWFYQNVPGDKNRIDVFDPHKLPNPIKSFPVVCKGGALDLTLSGLTAGPKGRLMTACGSGGGLSLDARTGKIGKTVPKVGDTDEVWFDPTTNSYYFAHATEGEAGSSGAASGAVGVVDAATEEFVYEIPFQGGGVHSVAVNAKNKHIFVPVYGKGIFVVAPGK
jgi:DNA-binding beta-propeller fold protein YncE